MASLPFRNVRKRLYDALHNVPIRPLVRDSLGLSGDYKRARTQAPVAAPAPPKEEFAMARSRTGYTRLSRRKRFRRRRRYARVSRSVQPFAVLRTMKSVATLSLNPGAGTVAANTMYLNSCVDPTGTVGTTQPLGFDQMTALYNKYCVISWSVKLEYCATDNTNPCVVGFTPTTNISTLSSLNHYKELAGTVSTFITPDIDKSALFARGGVKKYFLPPGGKLLSNENCVSAVGGSPTNILYGHVWAQAMDAAADPANIICVVTVWQKVVFFDPSVPARS